MNKKLILLSLVAFALIAGGCFEQNPFEAQSDDASLINDTPASLAKKGTKQVHIKGSFQTTFQFIPLVCIDPTSGKQVNCSTPGAVPVVASTPFQGTGKISHLGKSAVASSQTVDFTKPTPILFGTVEFTAANGDKLYATHTGTTVFPDATGSATYSGDMTFTGGTGKFMGASGSVEFTGGANIPTGKGYFSLRGTLKLKKHDCDDDD